MKICSKCLKEKEIESFPKRKGYKDGIYCWCYLCCNTYQKTYVGIEVNVTEQICVKCKNTKSSFDFSKSKTRKTGLDSRCKECYRDSTRERRGGLNKERVDRIELKLKGLFQCIKCEATLNLDLKGASDYNICCVCIKEQKRLYSRTVEYSPEKRRQEYLDNPFRYKEQRAKRRARAKNAKGSANKEQIKARFDYHGNQCIYCKSEDNLSIEHLIPLARGGTNWPSNIAPACMKCNLSKRALTYKEFKII